MFYFVQLYSLDTLINKHTVERGLGEWTKRVSIIKNSLLFVSHFPTCSCSYDVSRNAHSAYNKCLLQVEIETFHRHLSPEGALSCQYGGKCLALHP